MDGQKNIADDDFFCNLRKTCHIGEQALISRQLWVISKNKRFDYMKDLFYEKDISDFCFNSNR